MITKDLGVVTAYAYAVEGGYTGTEAEFTELLGNIAIDLSEIENLTVTVTTLPAGSSATASYSHGVLSLGIPKGDKGDKGDTGATGPTGNGISSITKTGTAGSVDTYTITYTNGNTTTFEVTNGEVTEAQLAGIIAGEYDSTKTYAVGDFCLHSGALYECTTAIATAEAWNSAHWTLTNAGGQIKELKENLNIINDGGAIDFSKGNVKFYNGYYSGSTYNGNGTEIFPPFSSWCVMLVHVIKDAKITISGMPTQSGTACVWLNSNSLTDVNSVGWASSESNGEKVCVTDWLALTGYKINPSSVNIVYQMYQSLLASVNSVENQFDTLESDAFNYITQMLDATKKTSGKYYYPNNTTIGSQSGMCLFPPIPLTANKTYTLVNIRPVFTNYKIGDTVTSVDGTDSGSTNKTMIFTPVSDGELYVTGGDSANVMVFDAEYAQNDYIYGKFNYTLDPSALEGVTETQCSFFKNCEQILKSADASADGYWNISGGKPSRSTATGQKTFSPFKLNAGTTYRLIDVYGYFCIIADANGNNAVRLTNVVSTQWSGYYTPSADCYIYMTVRDSYFGTTAMVLNDVNYLPEEYTEGVYYTYFIGNLPNKTVDIHVKQDGTGDYDSVVDAVNFANSQKGNYPINIYVHTGDYDILEELGGDDFLTTVLDSVDERQGLILKADNINLIGVGLVTLRYELADDVDYYQSSRTSCLNLREFSNRVENLTLIAKNCRYTIHDETNGGNPYIHRVMKNLRCIHKGNASGLWAYPTVMGGGAGGGSTYDVINCQFITSAYHQAFSYHSGANQEASMFNIDGCVGSVNADAPKKISFRLSYHGSDRTGISVGNIKSCSGNGQTVVEPEASGDTDNNIEMYVNGWETIEPIVVTGNE